jgi:diguanylate cyclase (GGDEF)-like protein
MDQFADSEKPSRVPEASRHELDTAVQAQDNLLRLCSTLNEKVTSLELALARAHQFANYDELTQLPNRRLLLDRFIQASALANRHSQVLALLFFDLNDFKSVNDKLGHDAGDQLLLQVATRLSTSIRESDTACRYGGDEFIVLLTEIVDREHAISALQKIRTHLDPPYVFDRYSIRLTVSTGMAIYPKDAQKYTDLIRLADRSMFSTKSGSQGRSCSAGKLNIWLHDPKKESCINR